MSRRPKAPQFTRYARPSFLYVIYAIILWAIPISVIGLFSPESAKNMAQSIGHYYGYIPESLWTLFGAAYLGYTAARQIGKIKGVE